MMELVTSFADLAVALLMLGVAVMPLLKNTDANIRKITTYPSFWPCRRQSRGRLSEWSQPWLTAAL
jgi:hypothetical protein